MSRLKVSVPLPAPQLQQVREELFRKYFLLLLSDRMPDRT